MTGVRIAGTGSYLPERVVTNDDLSQTLDTSDEWIRSRTGIRERHFAAPDEACSDMATIAGRRALEAAGVAPAELDMIIVATMTQDHPTPSTAALVQRNLEATNAGGFDLNCACTGFVSSSTTACGLIKTGLAKNVLVVGSEKMTTVIDPLDRATAVIFADGAGAALFQAADAAEHDLLAAKNGLKGDTEVLGVRAGGSRWPIDHKALEERANYVHMKGRETYKFAVTTFARMINETCAEAGVTPQDLDFVVPHQVNQRIIDAAAERVGITTDNFLINIGYVGNTSGASVGIALDEGVRAGRVKEGDLLLMVAFGAGLSWAAGLYRW